MKCCSMTLVSLVAMGLVACSDAASTEDPHGGSSAACPEDPGALDGTPCDAAGPQWCSYCGEGCQETCDVLTCTEGTWSSGLLRMTVVCDPDDVHGGGDLRDGAPEDDGDATGDPDVGPAPDTWVEPAPQPPPFYLGGDRPATYTMPFDYDGQTSVPLILSLHGFSNTGLGQDLYFGLSALTKTMGVMLIIPDGTQNPDGNQFWNATDACCNYYGSQVDDVAYLSSLIEEAQAHFAIDPKRVYLIGHSNGGFMSSRMACERSDLIAGFVNFAGATWDDPADCGDPDPVAMLHIHGQWDTTIPYGGVTPHEALPGDLPVVVDTCLAESCTEAFDACLADPGCDAYHDCLNACSTSLQAATCYDTCWLNASNETRVLWMPAFTCGLGAGCYVTDPQVSWAGYPGAVEIAERWAARNGCEATTAEGAALDLIYEVPGIDTIPTPHDGCPEGRQAELWTILYGSHSPAFTPSWGPALVNWLLGQAKP